MSKEVFVKTVLIEILGCACADFSSFVAEFLPSSAPPVTNSSVWSTSFVVLSSWPRYYELTWHDRAPIRWWLHRHQRHSASSPTYCRSFPTVAASPSVIRSALPDTVITICALVLFFLLVLFLLFLLQLGGSTQSGVIPKWFFFCMYNFSPHQLSYHSVSY